MGPPPFGDGNLPVGILYMAMLFGLQWGHRLSAMETNMVNVGLGALVYLQWGHRLSAMETTGYDLEIEVDRDLQWGHRLSAMETRNGRGRTPTWSAPFNGATAFRRWKRTRSARCRAGCPSFNGATAFRRWKRGVRETRLAAAGVAFNGATAFRRWKLSSTRSKTIRDITPSMGPPPFGDGNKHGITASDFVSLILQWGHRLSAMETLLCSIRHREATSLQWGHRLSAMETRNHPLMPPISIVTFNGATAFRRWKLLFVARLRHGFMQKRAFSQGSVTG